MPQHLRRHLATTLLVILGIWQTDGSQAQLWQNEISTFNQTVIPGWPVQDSLFGVALTTGRFGCDGDTIADLAIGWPHVDLFKAQSDEGSVLLLFGSQTPAIFDSPSLLSQAGPSVTSEPESLDHFGYAVARGDFNGDTCDDLAVGVPGENNNQGAVHIFLAAVQEVLFLRQGVGGLLGTEGVGDRFGASLTVGDFNGDDFDDLAIGAPGDGEGGAAGAGVVHVIYGSAGGLAMASPVANQFFNQASFGEFLFGPDAFGYALTAGDFNGDGQDDLAIGAPGRTVNGAPDAGQAYVALGTGMDGLTLAGSETFAEGLNGMPGVPREKDNLGAALTTGDFDGDTRDDLVIGLPGDSISFDGSTFPNIGRIRILYGTPTGPSSTDVYSFSGYQFPGRVADSEFFGWALTAGDFDADGLDDLAVGAPLARIDGDRIGTAFVVSGRVDRAFIPTTVLQPPPSHPPGSLFGYSLANADFDANGRADLAVGAPGASGIATGQGSVSIFRAGVSLVFMDDFETGNLVRWSFVFPPPPWS